ncbi:MAG: hypothetical protein ACFCUN_09415 [Hyphomicrobiaceae bacterium]
MDGQFDGQAGGAHWIGLFIALYGLVGIVCGVLGYALAATKRRDASAWGAWCFLFPPMVLLLLAMPTNRGARPRRMTLDEEDSLY